MNDADVWAMNVGWVVFALGALVIYGGLIFLTAELLQAVWGIVKERLRR